MKLAALFLAFATPLFAELPRVERVEAQPLLAQIRRMQEALDFLGQPLAEKARAELAAAAAETDDPKSVALAQAALDPLCLGAVTLRADGAITFNAAEKMPALIAQGWRACVVKVLNEASATSILKSAGPSVQPIANSPPDKVAERWLALDPVDRRPLAAELSGLALEYRVFDVWARAAGRHTARLAWSLTPPGAKKPAATSGETELAFEVAPVRAVKFAVRDERGEPTTASFLIRDAQGRVHPMQLKRLAPDFFFQPQIYRADGETLALPPGEYTIDCARGPESLPEQKKLVVGAGDAVVDYQVKRWVDPAARGWWSGDHHIHAAGCAHYTNPTEGVHAPDMARHIIGEDLKVGCNLTWGPCFDYQKQFFTGKDDPTSRWPYLLRYDIEVSGFGSHQSGHLCLLRLREQIPPGGDSSKHWPTLGMNTLRWAKKQGAVCGPAHSGAGLTGRPVGRIDGATDGPERLPNFDIPPYDGIGANEFVVDITHEVPGPDGKLVPALDFISTMDTDRRAEFNMWYHSLNVGFRIRASGETDFPCITGGRVGIGRVYVKQDEKLNYEAWCEGLRQGRSYVSDGTSHLMDFTAEAAESRRDSPPVAARPGHVALGEKGSELRLAAPGKITLRAIVAARTTKENGLGAAPARELAVEAIMNGRPVARRALVGDGAETPLEFEIDVARSSWVALRTYPHAHTNPIFVLVGGAPIRASRHSAEWLRRGVEQCWAQKERTYAAGEKDQARADYDHARRMYDRLIAESPEA